VTMPSGSLLSESASQFSSCSMILARRIQAQ
jgi:hypothetical protein